MNAPAPETFALRLKHLMKEKGLTQREIGLRCGVAQTAVSKWLRSTIPTKTRIQRLAIHFEVNEDWLLTGGGDMTLSAEDRRKRNATRTAEKAAKQDYLVRMRNVGRTVVISEGPAGGVREFPFDMATNEQWAFIKMQIDMFYGLITQI